jgi:signal transduction histidine kinase
MRPQSSRAERQRTLNLNGLLMLLTVRSGRYHRCLLLTGPGRLDYELMILRDKGTRRRLEVINMIPKTCGDRTERSRRDMKSSTKLSLASQEKGELQLDFLGKNIENIIAGVAVERKRTGKALRLLTGELIQAQEEERRRLARELHDGLSQQLAMLTVELGMVIKQIPESIPAIREELSRLQDRTERTSNELRRMTHQLHPAVLEHLGLVSALRSHCCEFSESEGIRIQFRAISEPVQVGPEAAGCLYRIAQEALRNVSKHARAEEAWVEIGQEGDEIRLSIVDKGTGFDAETPKADLCLGLISMRERVRLLSGKLKIKSAPGKGTRVDVRVPLASRLLNSRRRNHAKPQSEDFIG